MRWYSLTDIAAAYKITCDMLKYKINTGQLNAEKLFMGKSKVKNFKYIVPETELSKLEEYKQHDPIASPDAQPDYYENQRREREERRKQASEEAHRQHKEWLRQHKPRKSYASYYDYLCSEEWQQKRLQVLVRDHFKCQLCGSGKNVQVHHISYENLYTDAELDDLITLCKDCHEKVHSKDLERKFEKQTSDMHALAVSLLQEDVRAAAWLKFVEACSQRTPPLSAKEVSQIWQNALKVVFPL